LSELLPFEKATPAVAFCFLLNRLLAAEPWARLRLAPFAGETVELRAPPLHGLAGEGRRWRRPTPSRA
jgi:ubiquinone biosynthesis protein UbiJ